MKILSELLQQIAAKHRVIADGWITAIVDLTALRTVVGEESEKARRQLASPSLSTTYPWKIRAGLNAKLEADRRAMAKPLLVVLQKAAEIELGEIALEILDRVEAATSRDAAIRRETGMYAEAANVVDRLFDDHGVAKGHFGALNADDVAALARLIKERHAAQRNRPRP